MAGSFTGGLFGFLAYLIPGAIALVALAMLMPATARWPWSKTPALQLVAVLGLAFFAGVVAHVAASLVQGTAARLTGYSVMDRSLENFQRFAAVQDEVGDVFGAPPAEPRSVFRYAESYVRERSVRHAASASRLMALSMFCRNSLLPVLLLGVALLAKARPPTWRAVLAAVSGVVVLEVLLFRGFVSYYSAAVSSVLRTFLVLVA